MEFVQLWKVDHSRYSLVQISDPNIADTYPEQAQSLVIKGFNLRPVSLFFKKPIVVGWNKPDYSLPVTKVEYADKYAEIWLAFRKAGISTIPTLRLISDKKVAMTDLEANGSRLYDKLDRLHRRIGIAEYREGFDEKFLEIDQSEIESEATAIAQKATDANILLPSDQEFLSLLLHPNGSWKLLCVDFEFASLNSDTAAQGNAECLGIFKENIAEYRRLVRDLILNR